LKYVKGHQDCNSNTTLNTPALMNIRADNLATKALGLRNIKADIQHPSDKAIIKIHNKIITSNRTKILRSAFQSMNLRDYMKASNNWNDKQIEQIWWKPLEKILLNMSQGKQLIIKKFIHNQLPCNHHNNIMYEYKPPHCSLCPTIIEDQSHVIRCKKCPEREQIRNKYKKDLLNLLNETHTNETTTRVISSTINAWLNNASIPSLHELAPDASSSLEKAYAFQRDIGWEQFFKGRLSITWGELYNHDRSQPNIKRTKPPIDAETWGSNIIKLNWNLILDLWFTRNDKEHNLDNKSNEIAKRKLTERILWIKEKIDKSIDHPYQDSSSAELLKLPSNNLRIMIDQIQNIYEKRRLNSHKFELT
jgi:hypothetical protein